MPRQKHSIQKTTSKVAQLVSEYLNSSGKSQTEMARNMGYERPNILSMQKSGLSRLPYDRALSFCNESGGDLETLLITMIEEYDPVLLTIIETTKGVVISDFEKKLLSAVRNAKSDIEKTVQVEMRKNEMNYADKSRTRDFRLQFDDSPEAIKKLTTFITENMLTPVQSECAN